MYQKCGYEYLLFSLLNFPGATTLNFYDVIWLLHCPRYKGTVMILNNRGNHITSQNFKMVARGEFKRENSRYSYKNFWYIETSFPLFRKINTLIDFISNDLTSIFYNSGGSFKNSSELPIHSK